MIWVTQALRCLLLTKFKNLISEMNSLSIGGTLARSSQRGVDARLVVLGATGVGKSGSTILFLELFIQFINDYYMC